MAHRVRLGDVRQSLAAGAGEVERIAGDALGVAPADDGQLRGGLPRRADAGAPARPGQFTLDILAHDDEIDVLRLRVRQRIGDAGEEFAGAEVDVLIEGEAEGEERVREGDLVRDAGGATVRAEEDGVEAAQRVEAAGRHDRLARFERFARGPVEIGRLQSEAADGPLRRAQHAHRRRDDLPPDAVHRHDRNSVCPHRSSSLLAPI